MEVRLKTGRYAGELQDVRTDCAKQMIADGRAADPRIESRPEPVTAAAGDAAKGKKKGKR